MRYIAMKGCERTCSNFTLRSFLVNFDLIKNNNKTGWKHGHMNVEGFKAIPKVDLDDTLFVVTIKNPYAWLLSLRRGFEKGHVLAIHYQRNNCPYLKDFIQGYKQTYMRRLKTDPLIMEAAMNKYNGFYKHWLKEKAPMIPNLVVVRHEDMVADFHGTLRKVKQDFDLTQKRNKIHQDTKEIGTGGRVKRVDFQKDYYANAEYLTEMNDLQKKVVTENVDWDFFKQFNYEPIRTEK